MIRAMYGYGDVIRRAREAEGMSQGALATAISVDASMISKIERETVGISPAVYRKLVSGVLTTLRPAELLTAMGYPITVQGPDQLPVGLVRDLLRLDAEELRAIAILARRQSRLARRPVAEVQR